MTLLEEHGTPDDADPIPVAVRLRPPEGEGVVAHFGPSDLPAGLDVARHPRVARILAHRRLQFLLILPNQIVFWAVIVLGFAGAVVPGLNFATAITWYVWFCLVFVLMVVVGRGWCAMCPFGGFAEWIQRRALWQRAQRTLGLGRPLPEPVARYGFLLSAGAFILLTFIEEFFNIAGPGNPMATSFMVIGIVASAVVFFLVFERRTFCRYVCPLSGLIGTVGSMGSVAGFRTRDRATCMTCETKDCMRGGTSGYGCPWYTWPGSADSNLSCGLCTECYKACPSDNIGLFLQKPLTSVIAPVRRRADVAWVVALLWGLVVFQQLNALPGYAPVDGWLNRVTHFPHYPNPVAYLGTIVGVTLITAGLVWLVSRAFLRPGTDLGPAPDTFVARRSPFRAYFVPIAYGIIPVVGANYFARQLPKFFKHATRVVPAVGSLVGKGSTSSTLYKFHILTDPRIVVVQVVVMTLGTLAALWATDRIVGRELVPISKHPALMRLSVLAIPVAFSAVAVWLYILMHGAS